MVNIRDPVVQGHTAFNDGSALYAYEALYLRV